ncbi:MAG TPA: CPBP family intramembrane metalloprotease, partial [Lactococcus sp.]|nr:CPBP family intramembrane metalloprotease [Lactococcus sp.]
IFATQTIFAGFFEELTYRVGPFEILFEKNKILAFLTASLLFAAVHSPTDLYSWLLYGSMSLVLTSFYFKYRNFYLNMTIHMLWNFLGISATFLIN